MTKILYFKATWCAPCVAVSKQVEELKKAHPELSIETKDIDIYQTASAQLGIRSVPTIIVLDDNGNPKFQFQGSTAAKQLKETLGL
jgi:thioredoxin 1